MKRQTRSLRSILPLGIYQIIQRHSTFIDAFYIPRHCTMGVPKPETRPHATDIKLRIYIPQTHSSPFVKVVGNALPSSQAIPHLFNPAPEPSRTCTSVFSCLVGTDTQKIGLEKHGGHKPRQQLDSTVLRKSRNTSEIITKTAQPLSQKNCLENWFT